MACFALGAQLRRNLLSIPEKALSTPPRLRSRAPLVLFAFVMLLFFSTSRAQEYRGTITGQVTDSTGNVVPNATITATRPEQTYTGKTDGRGAFYIPYVQPGTYAIRAEAHGFNFSIRCRLC